MATGFPGFGSGAGALRRGAADCRIEGRESAVRPGGGPAHTSHRCSIRTIPSPGRQTCAAASVPEAIEHVGALLGLFLGRFLALALAIARLAADDDADLRADAAVLRLLEVGARDAVAALLAV